MLKEFLFCFVLVVVSGIFFLFPSFYFFLLQSWLEGELPVPVQESVAKGTSTVICLPLFGC